MLSDPRSLTTSESMRCLTTEKYDSLVASSLGLLMGFRLAKSQHTRAQPQHQALPASDSQIIGVSKPAKLATTWIGHHQLCAIVHKGVACAARQLLRCRWPRCTLLAISTSSVLLR